VLEPQSTRELNAYGYITFTYGLGNMCYYGNEGADELAKDAVSAQSFPTKEAILPSRNGEKEDAGNPYGQMKRYMAAVKVKENTL
jgi:hypothetical protein